MASSKDALRREMMRKRAAIPALERARSGIAIQEAACALVEELDAERVLVYVSYRSEVSTRALMRWVAETGRTVLVPGGGASSGFPVVRLEDPTAVVEGLEGPPLPARPLPFDGQPDVVFCPGLAFDRAGRRLGYGRGHFDAYLATLPARVVKVGLCFEAQVLDELPEEDHDVRMDALVTERGVRRIPVEPA